MPFPQIATATRRPPFPHNSSSPSSIHDFTQDVPSFVDFVSRTPTPEQQMSLPFMPNERRRSSSTPPRRSSSPRPLVNRRSSSIYSRTISQWAPESTPWQSSDFADRPPFTAPAAAHDVKAFDSSEEALLPTRGSITTKQQWSHDKASGAHEDWSPPSTLLPPTPISRKVPEGNLHTVSLKRVDDSIVLPSNTRTQIQSQELRLHTPKHALSGAYVDDGTAELACLEKYQCPHTSTSLSEKGQDKPYVEHSSTYSTCTTKSTSPSELHHREMIVGRGRPRVMVSLANQNREESRTKVTQSLGLLEPDEPRGRTRRRGPRQLDYTHYLPQATIDDTDGSEDENAETDARKIARQYHAVLTDQYRQGSACSDSDESVKRHMKMVPHALFYGKPPPRPSLGLHSAFDTNSPVKCNARTGSTSSLEDHNLTITAFSKVSGKAVGSPCASRLRTFVTYTTSDHSRQSSTGSIPISPPDSFNQRQTSEARGLPSKEGLLESSGKRQNKRVSVYYPHVMSRKKAKRSSARALRSRQLKYSEQTKPSKLVLAADIIAERDRTDDLLFSDPAASSNLLSSPLSQHKRTDSIHLGWSDRAKASFDHSRASVEPTTLPHRPIEHVVTPAKPLGMQKHAESEGSGRGVRRRSSVFSGILELRREAKAEKRRRELRKMIRVVQDRGGEDATITI